MKARTDRYGLDTGYEDASGRRRATSAPTRRAIVEAMGGAPAAGPPPVVVATAGRRKRMPGWGELRLEDGSRRTVGETLPADVPPGYHEFQPAAGSRAVTVIVSPGRCPLPPRMRQWGWAVQLYSAYSSESQGIGDLADLERLARWSASLGAGLLLINPLPAVAPVVPQQPSPYYPCSRRFRNPIYLRVEGLGPEPPEGSRIDRDRVFRRKLDALAARFERESGDAAFEDYWRAEGEPLHQFAAYCTLAEAHGGDWRQWPMELRDPRSAAVRRFAAGHASRLRFHGWLQWLIDRQLEAASRPLALLQDLPVGVDPGGADAWVWQDYLALGVGIGAPPDPYSAGGQDWGLPPFIPHRLREARYQPFIQTLRAALRHAGGLRIDHAMGLFRLFWIPAGMTPMEGAYVRYPVDDLLGILALEAHRAGAFVVGEDLGTVEPGVREKLARHSILSSRVLWFEDAPPAGYPERSMASIATHDLPTVAGAWSGTDQAPNCDELRNKLAKLTGLPGSAAAADVVAHAYRALAAAPSAAVLASLEDALAVEERPNIPGTVQPSNWSTALPLPLEKVEAHPLAHSIAQALNRRELHEPLTTISGRS